MADRCRISILQEYVPPALPTILETFTGVTANSPFTNYDLPSGMRLNILGTVVTIGSGLFNYLINRGPVQSIRLYDQPITQGRLTVLVSGTGFDRATLMLNGATLGQIGEDLTKPVVHTFSFGSPAIPIMGLNPLLMPGGNNSISIDSIQLEVLAL